MMVMWMLIILKKYDLWTAAGDGESQVNRWFTYTENNGVYTLKPRGCG